MDGRTVTSDLLTATSVVDDEPMAPVLGVVHDVAVWMRERLEHEASRGQQ